MLIKILGAADILAGLVLLFGAGIKVSVFILVPLGVILLAKSFFGMLKDFGSWIDFSCAIVLILSAFVAIPWFVSVLFSILILQKGVTSFL